MIILEARALTIITTILNTTWLNIMDQLLEREGTTKVTVVVKFAPLCNLVQCPIWTTVRDGLLGRAANEREEATVVRG